MAKKKSATAKVKITQGQEEPRPSKFKELDEDGLLNLIMWYMFMLCLIIATVPLMHDWFYLPSFELIAEIQTYQTPEFTKIMNVFSFIGDGEVFFFGFCTYYVLDYNYEFAFHSITFLGNQHWINWLKTQIRHSRPQFDEPSLGISNESKQCSGEFGNPSGHALLSAMFITNVIAF